MAFRVKSLSHFASRLHHQLIFEVREDEEEEYYHLVTLWKAAKQEQDPYEECRHRLLKKIEGAWPTPVIPEIVTRLNCLIVTGQTTIGCRRRYLPQRAYLTPRGGLFSLCQIQKEIGAGYILIALGFDDKNNSLVRSKKR